MHNIIELIQEPKIAEQLEQLKDKIEERTKGLIKLAENANEDNVKELKKEKAELIKEFAELEEKRKALKNAIMQPYLAFEEKYKYITASYKHAETVAKNSIDQIEQGIKEEKRAECIRYFEELKQAYKLDWLKFESMGLKIDLSSSLKSQKDKIWTFIDGVYGDLQAIGDNAELLAEYKKCLNLAKATNIVNERAKAIERAKAEQERLKAIKEEQAKAEQKVQETIQVQAPLQAPKVEEEPKQSVQAVEDRKLYTIKFAVTGTKAQLKVLKEFLEHGGYKYE